MSKEQAVQALVEFRDSYYWEPKRQANRDEPDFDKRRAHAIVSARDAGATFIEISDAVNLAPSRVSHIYKRSKGICPSCGQRRKDAPWWEQ